MSRRRTHVLALLLGPLLFAANSLAQVANPVAARDLVLDELLRGDTDGIRIMVHPELLAPGTDVLTWHRTALVTPSPGYVVFIDDYAFANFEHPCRYVFVDGETGAFKVTPASTPPRGMLAWLEMETEAFRVLTNAKNTRAPRSLQPASSPRETLRGGEYYAILMNGGADSGNNHVRYWNDLSNIYITLVDVYGYKDENIIVLCSDGLDPTPDQSNGMNSHPDLDGDGDDDIMYSCVHSNVQSVFTQMIAQLTASDQLFVYTTDHGSSNGGWNTYLNLWNYESLTDAQLASMMAALPQCDMITTMEQCYSGGFEDNVSVTSGRVFSSACAHDELSWAMPPDYAYDTYVFFWTAAVKGEDAYGIPCDADANSDGKVSMQEAFLYAELHDISAETPQYNSMPSGLGDSVFLGSGPALAIRFSDPLPDGLCPPGPETTITLDVYSGYENYVPGSGQFLFRFDPSDPYSAVSLIPLGGDQYEVTLPHTEPGDEPEFYFSALGDGGTTVHSPPNAPSDVHDFEVGFVTVEFVEDFESDPGWTTEGQWAFGNPTGGGGQYGNPDPTSGHTGSNVYGYNLFGDYANDLPQRHLISPAIDFSGVSGSELMFWRYLNVEQPNYDHAKLGISTNGTTYTTLWENDGEITDSDWSQVSYDIAAIADGQPAVYLRWTMGTTDSSWQFSGWNIDDLSVVGCDYDATLWAEQYEIPVGTGGSADLVLGAGIAHAGELYVVAGTLSGTDPGFDILGLHVPLNWDQFTSWTIQLAGTGFFQNFSGVLDGAGEARATFDTQGPLDLSWVGLEASFAYCTLPLSGFVSNPITVTFVN
jgi:hypothetical protein